MPVEVGQILEGRVTGITNFGAFCRARGECDRPCSHFRSGDTFVKDVNDYLKQGETIKVKVIAVSDDGKISLSIPKLKEKSQDKRQKEREEASFEDKLAKFLKDSEERLLDIKRIA